MSLISALQRFLKSKNINVKNLVQFIKNHPFIAFTGILCIAICFHFRRFIYNNLLVSMIIFAWLYFYVLRSIYEKVFLPEISQKPSPRPSPTRTFEVVQMEEGRRIRRRLKRGERNRRYFRS